MNASVGERQGAAHGVRGDLPPVVLLHGWGSDSRALAALAQRLAASTAVFGIDLPGFGRERGRPFPVARDALLADLAARIPRGAVLVGWSLGGALATLLAQAEPARYAGLVTIATNPCFVQRADWSCAMPAAQFDGFRAETERDSAARLRSFAALQAHGDTTPREITRALRDAAEGCAATGDLLVALDLLAALDLREVLADVRVPVLHILGEKDALVPAAVAAHHAASRAHPGLLLLERAAHAPFLSAEATVAARIVDFLASRCTGAGPAGRDKHRLARSFAQAAPGYDGAAALQRDIGSALDARLPARAARRVLDLGCGTGTAAVALRSRYPGAELVQLDIAPGMLRVAAGRDASAARICADAERLPLAAASIDVAFSNLALQWSEDLPRWMDELARVLATGGEALLSTFGPDTLWELRAAWRMLDADVHVNRFATFTEVESAAGAAGLECVAFEPANRLRGYPDVMALARELRQLGAHNINPGRRTGLAGRATWQRLQQCYAGIRGGDEGIAATFQVGLFHLRKT